MKTIAVYDSVSYTRSNLSGIRNEFVGLRMNKYPTCLYLYRTMVHYLNETSDYQIDI